MILVIDTHSGVPIYRQLIDQITRQILAGQIAPGDQLPTVRELAVRLKINPMTISKAYSLLEATGLLQRQRGVGLFVAGIEDQTADRGRADLLREQLRAAAVLAVQLRIPLSEAVEQLRRLYEEIDTMEGNQT